MSPTIPRARPNALAISAGNVHLQTSAETVMDRPALATIEAAITCPLVLHGASGIRSEERHWLATKTKVCNFNVGAELHQTFASALRDLLATNTQLFDRNQILSAVKPALIEQTKSVVRSIHARGV